MRKAVVWLPCLLIGMAVAWPVSRMMTCMEAACGTRQRPSCWQGRGEAHRSLTPVLGLRERFARHLRLPARKHALSSDGLD